jgi:hypothetical protein
MAMVEAGERVLPIGATGGEGGGTVVININLSGHVIVDSDRRMDQLAHALWSRIKDRQRRQLTA